MGLFDRFSRKNKEILPEEVEKYYQSQRRARVGTAWLLGFLTLVVTLAVALGLYYGGRYVYRQATDNNTSEVTTDQDQAGSLPQEANQDDSKPKKKKTDSQNGSGGGTNGSASSPRTGDTLPANGDDLPATGDPGL